MKGKSVSTQLLEFLQTNSGEYPSGELQRMTWKNADGTTALPRTVVRRLQELAEDKKIYAKIVGNHTHYSADPIAVPPPKAKREVRDPLTGEVIAMV